MKYVPDHLTPVASPSSTAALMRYHETAICGGRAVGSAARSSRALAQSRCISSRLNAPSASTMMKMSSRPVRLIVIPTPSIAISTPPNSAIGRLWNRRSSTRISTMIAIVPAIAVAARHAKGFAAPPKSLRPHAMNHLPTGGCTTYSAESSHRSVSPLANGMFGLTSCPRYGTVCGQLRGSPVWSIVHASLT